MITQQQALERAYAALSAAAFAHPSAADAIGTQCSEAAKELRQYIEQGAQPVADVQRGAFRDGCSYMAPEGMLCNKCGRIHAAPQPQQEQP